MRNPGAAERNRHTAGQLSTDFPRQDEISIHDLLYQPRLIVEEGVLASILANLASALNVMSELLLRLPQAFVRSQPLEIALEKLRRLAADICSNCVPDSYTPRLVFWMDRIQATARTIK